jgi:hypothetical protein
LLSGRHGHAGTSLPNIDARSRWRRGARRNRRRRVGRLARRRRRRRRHVLRRRTRRRMWAALLLPSRLSTLRRTAGFVRRARLRTPTLLRRPSTACTRRFGSIVRCRTRVHVRALGMISTLLGVRTLIRRFCRRRRRMSQSRRRRRRFDRFRRFDCRGWRGLRRRRFGSSHSHRSCSSRRRRGRGFLRALFVGRRRRRRRRNACRRRCLLMRGRHNDSLWFARWRCSRSFRHRRRSMSLRCMRRRDLDKRRRLR